VNQQYLVALLRTEDDPLGNLSERERVREREREREVETRECIYNSNSPRVK
jgi:hypothetical protein